MKKILTTTLIASSVAIVSGCEMFPEMQTRAAPQAEPPTVTAPAAQEPVSDPRPFIPRGSPEGGDAGGGGFGGGGGGGGWS